MTPSAAATARLTHHLVTSSLPATTDPSTRVTSARAQPRTIAKAVGPKPPYHAVSTTAPISGA